MSSRHFDTNLVIASDTLKKTEFKNLPTIPKRPYSIHIEGIFLLTYRSSFLSHSSNFQFFIHSTTIHLKNNDKLYADCKIIQPQLPLIAFFRCLPAPVWSVDEKHVEVHPVGRAETFPALIVAGFVRIHLVLPALRNTNIKQKLLQRFKLQV